MKKVFQSIVEVPVIVLADNEKDAAQQISRYLSDEIYTVQISDIVVEQIEGLDQIHHTWTPDCIPYNNEDSLTLEDIFEDK